MTWVWIFLGIGVIGLISTVCWAVWLFHRAADVYGEVKELGKRGEELADLLSQVKVADLDRVAADPGA